jgi:dihydropteroate synthase
MMSRRPPECTIVVMSAAVPIAALRTPCLMGIVNITPNSFSDGGAFLDPAAAAARARQLAGEGATILDLGAEASSFFRAGVEPVAPGEQLRRLLPVLQQLQDLPPGVLISVDTRSAAVAREAIRAGAAIINDISAGTHDPEMLPAVAETAASVILMHTSANYPTTPAADDPDIVATVRKVMAERVRAAMQAGIPAKRIALDPGIGFGKTMADNWRLAWRAAELGEGFPIVPLVLGISRKRFLETPAPRDVPVPEVPPDLLRQFAGAGRHPRDAATAALTFLVSRRGVAIHRVHEVAVLARQFNSRPETAA